MAKKPKRKRKAPEKHVAVARYEEVKRNRHAMIRKLVLEHGRIDILCEYVLDKDRDAPLWFHEEMMLFQDAHAEGLILAFRGARKTHYCSIARTIFEILRNPNVRILLTADAADQSKAILRAVKDHFENNEELREIFGDYVTDARKWTDSEIIVNKRTAVGLKEATVTAAGIDTSLLGKHFDVIIGDDLVTEENSATDGQRKKVHNYFYKTILGCLEPDGRLWIIGTRWDEDDLYGHLAGSYFEPEAQFRIGILDEETDESIWEDRFPTARMHRIRKGNLAAFELQWMCRTGVGMGGIFTEEHFRYYSEIHDPYFKWQGVDLAVGTKARNDFFAHVTIAVTKGSRDIYLVEFRERKIPFPKQVPFINAMFRAHRETVRVGIEANAFQIALTQQVRAEHPDIPVMPRYTQKDKIARAQQLAFLAVDKPIHVLRGHHRFVRRMCAFPNGPKDLFDAFDIAVDMGVRGVRRKGRDKEVGLI